MHNIIRRSYPVDCDKSVVQDDLDILCSEESDSGSGLPQAIRWLTNEPICESLEDANLKISELDNGWYDQLAIRYYVSEPINKVSKAYEKAKESLKAANDAEETLKQKINETFFNRKSEFVGCKHCGSRLKLEYLRRTTCPLCNNSLLSDTDLKRLEAAKNRSITANSRLVDEEDKMQAKANASAKKRKVNWLVKIEYHS